MEENHERLPWKKNHLYGIISDTVQMLHHRLWVPVKLKKKKYGKMGDYSDKNVDISWQICFLKVERINYIFKIIYNSVFFSVKRTALFTKFIYKQIVYTSVDCFLSGKVVDHVDRLVCCHSNRVVSSIWIVWLLQRLPIHEDRRWRWKFVLHWYQQTGMESCSSLGYICMCSGLWR